MQARIYTEDKNPTLVPRLVSLEFEGFTIIKGVGYWKGMPEPATIIEIIDTDDSPMTDFIDKVERTAERIKAINHQEAVLVTYQTLVGTVLC